MAMDEKTKKAKQRERWRAEGWVELRVRVAREHQQAVKQFAASLPPPSPPTDPRQLDLIAKIDAEIEADEGDASPQGALL